MTNEELVLKIRNENNPTDDLMMLYSQNAGMIEKIIRKYRGIEELDDLRQESYFAIVKAVQFWNPEKGSSFINYAAYWITATVVRYIDECSGVIRIPSHKRALIGRYNREVNRYYVRFGDYPSDLELRALLELTQEQLERLKADIKAARIRSTSEVIGGEEDDLTLEDIIPAEGDAYEEVIEKIQHEQLSDTLWACVDGLNPQQTEVVRGHFKDGKTLKECGELLGVSTERVRQIEQNALRELRKSRNVKRLRPYLTDQAAYTMGLKYNGIGSFKRCGSSQERAVMRLEELTEMSLWRGKELYLETSIQK